MARKNTLTRFLVDDDESSDGPSPSELGALQASLADLTAKVSELAALQQSSSPRAKTTTSS
jgi:hypothetical protein